MKRKIIKIDASLCNGCGICVSACHEGAIGMVEGKAKLLRDDYCDGLGDCLPVCPTDAITFEEREAAAYDAAAVQAAQAKQPETLPCGCPGTHAKSIERKQSNPADADAQASVAASKPETLPCSCSDTHVKSIERKQSNPADADTQASVAANSPETLPCGCSGTHVKSIEHCQSGTAAPPVAQSSQLQQWPVQIKLVPARAPYLEGANLLIAADCTAFAYGNFHQDFIRNRITLVGCPKLDEGDYSEKLTDILANNTIKSVTVVRMEVPCCGGIENAVKTALRNCGKLIPWQVVVVSVDGRILEDA